MMQRELLGHLAGMLVYVAGFYWWFVVKNRAEPKAALAQVLPMGVAYLLIYLMVSRLLQGN